MIIVYLFDSVDISLRAVTIFRTELINSFSGTANLQSSFIVLSSLCSSLSLPLSPVCCRRPPALLCHLHLLVHNMDHIICIGVYFLIIYHLVKL